MKQKERQVFSWSVYGADVSAPYADGLEITSGGIIMIERLHTIDEIKRAVDAGKPVYVETKAYKVIKDSIGQYLIKCSLNDYCIGLHGREGTEYESKLNGSGFFIAEE